MKVLLALDGSDGSRKAAKHIAQLASECGRFAITVYHVLPTPKHLESYGEFNDPEEGRRMNDLMEWETERSMEEERGKAEAEILEPAEQMIREMASHVTILRKFGPEFHRSVPDAIVQEARDGDYDVIALGRRGRSALAEVVFGSVTSAVLHQAGGRAVWIVD